MLLQFPLVGLPSVPCNIGIEGLLLIPVATESRQVVLWLNSNCMQVSKQSLQFLCESFQGTHLPSSEAFSPVAKQQMMVVWL